jgi:putative aminopeptidase FrvX
MTFPPFPTFPTFPFHAALLVSITTATQLDAQSPRGETSVSTVAVRLASIAAVTGYEHTMVDTLLRLLPGGVRDRAGNARLQLGSRPARRLVVCPLDEPGYVVGSVREDGYLTLRRVPGEVPPLFDQQLEGHRVTIQGRRGPIPGVVAVRSIHLTRGREELSEVPFTVDEAYVDVGAGSRAQATALGVGVLSPVTLAKRPHRYGEGLLAAPAAGRRIACAALLDAVRQSTLRTKLIPPVTIGFVTQQRLSERGLRTLANELGPFEETLIVDGRPGARGSLQQGADADISAQRPALGRVTRWSLPVAYHGTPVETASMADAESLRDALVKWIAGER